MGKLTWHIATNGQEHFIHLIHWSKIQMNLKRTSKPHLLPWPTMSTLSAKSSVLMRNLIISPNFNKHDAAIKCHPEMKTLQFAVCRPSSHQHIKMKRSSWPMTMESLGHPPSQMQNLRRPDNPNLPQAVNVVPTQTRCSKEGSPPTTTTKQMTKRPRLANAHDIHALILENNLPRARGSFLTGTVHSTSNTWSVTPVFAVKLATQIPHHSHKENQTCCMLKHHIQPKPATHIKLSSTPHMLVFQEHQQHMSVVKRLSSNLQMQMTCTSKIATHRTQVQQANHVLLIHGFVTDHPPHANLSQQSHEMDWTPPLTTLLSSQLKDILTNPMPDTSHNNGSCICACGKVVTSFKIRLSPKTARSSLWHSSKWTTPGFVVCFWTSVAKWNMQSASLRHMSFTLTGCEPTKASQTRTRIRAANQVHLTKPSAHSKPFSPLRMQMHCVSMSKHALMNGPQQSLLTLRHHALTQCAVIRTLSRKSIAAFSRLKIPALVLLQMMSRNHQQMLTTLSCAPWHKLKNTLKKWTLHGHKRLTQRLKQSSTLIKKLSSMKKNLKQTSPLSTNLVLKTWWTTWWWNGTLPMMNSTLLLTDSSVVVHRTVIATSQKNFFPQNFARSLNDGAKCFHVLPNLTRNLDGHVPQLLHLHVTRRTTGKMTKPTAQHNQQSVARLTTTTNKHFRNNATMQLSRTTNMCNSSPANPVKNSLPRLPWSTINKDFPTGTLWMRQAPVCMLCLSLLIFGFFCCPQDPIIFHKSNWKLSLMTGCVAFLLMTIIVCQRLRLHADTMHKQIIGEGHWALVFLQHNTNKQTTKTAQCWVVRNPSS